jgi:hypothetical protein
MTNTPDDPLYWFAQKYPDCHSENELEKMKEFLEGYADLLLRIFERAEGDPVFRAEVQELIEKNRKQENQGI